MAKAPLVFAGSHPSSLKIYTTQPDAILRHDISDEEMTAMCAGNSSKGWDAMWAFLGAAIGAAPNALSFLLNFGEKHPIDRLELIQLIIFFVSAAVGVALYLMCKDRGKGPAELAKEIRERTRRG